MQDATIAGSHTLTSHALQVPAHRMMSGTARLQAVDPGRHQRLDSPKVFALPTTCHGGVSTRLSKVEQGS